MIRLNPEELVVASFETVAEPPPAANDGAATKLLCTIDPTSCTYCFVCPPVTTDCA